MEEYVFNGLKERYVAIKKWKANDAQIAASIDYVLKSIDEFNDHIDQYSTMFKEYEISQIPVMDELKGFVTPSVVKLNILNYVNKDLLVKVRILPKQNDFFENWNLETYINHISFLRGVLKRDPKDALTMLDTIKIGKNLMDIIDVVSFDEQTQVHDHGFIPVPVQPWIKSFYTNSCPYMSREEAIKEYIRSILL